MTRKLFLRLDRGSLSADDMTAFVSAAAVTDVDSSENCFQYSFAPVVLDHALLLVGENNSKFGFDLWHYLYSARGFFGQTPDGFVVMPDSTPDFKRRFSEDLGVAIGSLFLVDSLSVKWETVAQIPLNKKLDKHAKTPDFVGFDTNGDKRVYECKGTTVSNDVDKHRQKAKDQLAQHQEANVPKYATVSYIPSSTKLLPPFLFVSDPPIPLPLISEAVATGLHYVMALAFAGQDALIDPLRRMIAQRHLLDELISNGEEPSWQQQNTLTNLNTHFQAAANGLAQQSGLEEFQGERFAGEWRVAQEKQDKVRAFTGVSVKQIVDMASAFTGAPMRPDPQQKFKAPRFQAESIIHETEPELFSLFSDGTLLRIENPNQR